MSTLRLKFPQWQGGVNPNYVFGSELLYVIAPENDMDETVSVKVSTDFDKPIVKMDGVDCGTQLLTQMQQTRQILEDKQPDKIIVFGGDCAVTQVPFDYLSGKYKDGIGVLWLDAHPDCSTIKETSHLHEMVMGNLIGLSQDSEITAVMNPYKPDHVMLAGLIEEDLREMDMACKRLQMPIVSPEGFAEDSNLIIDWMEEKNIKYIAVHWDLDVLSPVDYRSIYPAEPYTDVNDFPAAVGRLTLDDVARVLKDVSEHAEIVGLSMTEHLPWDAFRMRKALAGIPIFM